MNPLHVKQGTPEWLQMRVGRCTASRVGDVLNRLKNGQPGARKEELPHRPGDGGG